MPQDFLNLTIDPNAGSITRKQPTFVWSKPRHVPMATLVVATVVAAR